MIFRRERCKQTVSSLLLGVFRSHSLVPCPTGGPMTAGMERPAPAPPRGSLCSYSHRIRLRLSDIRINCRNLIDRRGLV
jgi:hypothetical protein